MGPPKWVEGPADPDGGSVTGVAEMTAVGLGLDRNVFREAAKGGSVMLCLCLVVTGTGC